MTWQRFTGIGAALMSVPAAVTLAGLLQAVSLSVSTSVPVSTPRPSLTPIHPPSTIHVTRSTP